MGPQFEPTFIRPFTDCTGDTLKEGWLQRESAIKYPEIGQLVTVQFFPRVSSLEVGVTSILDASHSAFHMCHENVAFVSTGSLSTVKKVCVKQTVLVSGTGGSGGKTQKVRPPLSPTHGPHKRFYPQ